jgi:PIN domain nuclease of toxin-antitoxin system
MAKLYCDTHVVVWLYSKALDQFTPRGIKMMEGHDLVISPMVCLELDYLREIKKITVQGQKIIEELSGKIGLQVCDASFSGVITVASELSWTRDPFDRIIVAQAKLQKAHLLTRDQAIRDIYSRATW